jgi:hypothetical protein
MKALISKIALYCLLPVCALAEDVVYSISNVTAKKTPHWIWIGRELRKDSPMRLEAKLRVSRDVQSADVIAKAYIYDQNKNLIASYQFPCRVGPLTPNYGDNGLPEVFKKNTPADVYFALTPEILSKSPNAMLVVFGDKKSICVKSKNEANPEDFEFPEKARFLATKK